MSLADRVSEAVAQSDILAHGGQPGAVGSGDVLVMVIGGVVAAIGLTLFLVNPSSLGPAARLKRAGAPLLSLGILTAILGPSLLPAPAPPCARSTTNARVEIVSPDNGQTFQSSRIPVEVRLEGAKLTELGSISNVSDQGHLHLSLDDKLVSMTGAETQTLEAPVGEHDLVAEFVANDHAPFCTRVSDSVSFTVES